MGFSDRYKLLVLKFCLWVINIFAFALPPTISLRKCSASEIKLNQTISNSRQEHSLF